MRNLIETIRAKWANFIFIKKKDNYEKNQNESESSSIRQSSVRFISGLQINVTCSAVLILTVHSLSILFNSIKPFLKVNL